jgi:fibronectin type 3 domain-containing protein
MSVRLVARIAVPAAVALALIAPQAAAATPDRTSPAAPVNLRITATTSSSVSLAWDAGKSGSGISHYTVLEKTRWSHFFVPATETTFNHARLTPNSTYSWVVYAVDRNGKRSADSNTVTYRTPSDTTPPSTPSLSAPYVGPRLVQLDWTDSVDDVTNVRYTVNVDGSAVGPVSESEMVLPLAPSSSYTISVTARDNWGNAATSNTVAVTTPQADNTSPPSAPPNLTGFEVAGCEGWLSWDASTDDVDPPAVIRYDAYVNGQFDSSAFGYTSTIVYALENGINRFTIVAVDSSGNESPPSTVEIPNMWLC